MIGPINFTWSTSRSLPDVRSWVSSSVADTLRKSGYRMESDTADELVMTHRGRSSWPLLLFSVVAIWLSDQRSYQVVFTFFTEGGLTKMFVIGELPTRVSSILYELPQG